MSDNHHKACVNTQDINLEIILCLIICWKHLVMFNSRNTNLPPFIYKLSNFTYNIICHKSHIFTIEHDIELKFPLKITYYYLIMSYVTKSMKRGLPHISNSIRTVTYVWKNINFHHLLTYAGPHYYPNFKTIAFFYLKL